MTRLQGPGLSGTRAAENAFSIADVWLRALRHVSIAAMDNAESVGYRFGRVELDLGRGCMRVADVDVAATPLPMKLLALLCERAGQLVTRAELFDALWPRQDISDDALNKLISRLRELLGADAEAIVTVRKQGLRLDAAVERLLRPETADPPPLAVSAAVVNVRRALHPWLLGLLALVAIADRKSVV